MGRRPVVYQSLNGDKASETDVALLLLLDGLVYQNYRLLFFLVSKFFRFLKGYTKFMIKYGSILIDTYLE